MKKVVVLGAGMVGSAIAVDLCLEYQVKVVDVNKPKLDELKAHHLLETEVVDFSKFDDLSQIIDDYDLVIGAVPGFMGFETLKKIINAGKSVVDISFFDEDPFELESLAKEKNVTVVVDCGIAPGLSNILLGHQTNLMEVDSYTCMVGGLPFKRVWPYEYKAPFSPIDVIEEYTRPARIVVNGKIILEEALSDVEYVNIEPVGSLEAFNTDGLRTLINTMKIPNMKEKTLRYPRHSEYIKVLRNSGFFRKDPVKINGFEVNPIDLTKNLLFPLWKLEENEKEFTVMQIKIVGKENGKRKECIYHLYDKYDEKTKTTSMARTTGYTCTSVARLVLEEHFNDKGICPPEYIGMQPGNYDKIVSHLKERNIIFNFNEKISED